MILSGTSLMPAKPEGTKPRVRVRLTAETARREVNESFFTNATTSVAEVSIWVCGI